MSYNRLTDKEHRYKKCVSCKYRNCQYCDDIYDIEKEAHNRLAELEDKIENGTLIELPCKVGDTVYVFDTDKNGETKISEEIVKDYNIDSNSFLIIVQERKYTYFLSGNSIGDDWFLTKAEAEAKLKEQ